MEFYCPLDGKPLSTKVSSLACPDGHSFDIAREGYSNLLLVQQKATLSPGDNKDMVEARRRFLAAGYFAPIAKKQNEIVKSLEATRILDAGCGEGYYLGALQVEMPQAELAGIDISKWAVKAAAKSHKNISWAVASNKQLPFSQLDLILCVFGFPFWESFRTALESGGYVLLVDPGPEHLLEFREIIYDKVKTNDLSSIEGAVGFTLIREEKLDFDIELKTNAVIQDLLSMTPHGYRITAEAKVRLSKLKELKTKVSVVFRVLKS